jgi:integrase
MLRAGSHPKVVSEQLTHTSVDCGMDTSSHVLPGMQEAAADTFDRGLEAPVEQEDAR